MVVTRLAVPVEKTGQNRSGAWSGRRSDTGGGCGKKQYKEAGNAEKKRGIRAFVWLGEPFPLEECVF